MTKKELDRAIARIDKELGETKPKWTIGETIDFGAKVKYHETKGQTKK